MCLIFNRFVVAHLERHGSQVILPVVQIFHSTAIFVGEGIEEEPLHNAALANTSTSQDHQPDAFVIAHNGVYKRSAT